MGPPKPRLVELGALAEQTEAPRRLAAGVSHCHLDPQKGDVSPSLHTGPDLAAGVQARLCPAPLAAAP
ncbi:MAG: hypothetical protein ACQETQ_13780, partial [Spirochaetota bacterium]